MRLLIASLTILLLLIGVQSRRLTLIEFPIGSHPLNGRYVPTGGPAYLSGLCTMDEPLCGPSAMVRSLIEHLENNIYDIYFHLQFFA